MVKKLFTFIVLSVLVIGGIYLWQKTPVRDNNWVSSHQVLPRVQLNETQLTIDGIRDFRYQGRGEVAHNNYLSQSYSLNHITQVWYGLSHFSGHGLAHAFLSFEFSDGRFLVASIEARMKPEQEYHPVKGMFRQYNRMVVFGTEQDVIGLRSHYRQEKVLLYPLTLAQEQKQALLALIVQDAMAVYQQADFYNTVLDNCITGIIRHSHHWPSFRNWLDYRILLPGYSDRLAHQYHFIDSSKTLNELQVQATVNASESDPLSPEFSQQIRAQWQQ